MTDAPFVHLHVHSYYSFLDGASSPDALARRAADLGQPALALTDWHGLYGAIEHRDACARVGVRPIFGAEIALHPHVDDDGPPGHLTLLARDADGWRSLCRLLTAAQLAGSKGQAWATPALLVANTAGLTCLTGCRRRRRRRPLLTGDEDGALKAARWLLECFGDSLWIELPLNEREDDLVLARRLACIAARICRGTVATANVHYADPIDPLADTLACIRAGTTLDSARHLRPNDRYHLAGAAEMRDRCPDFPRRSPTRRLSPGNAPSNSTSVGMSFPPPPCHHVRTARRRRRMNACAASVAEP
ncbi:MAG: PHP domain-containing protein [Chloroflexia bacterium]